MCMPPPRGVVCRLRDQVFTGNQRPCICHLEMTWQGQACWDSWEPRQPCQSSGNIDSLKIDLLWDPVQQKSIPAGIPWKMHEPSYSEVQKNYFVVLRSKELIQIRKETERLRVAWIPLFLVRNTLQRVSKIHSSFFIFGVRIPSAKIP